MTQEPLPATGSTPKRKSKPRTVTTNEISASGIRIDLTPNSTGRVKLPGRRMDWHENAWRWYDSLGPIRYAHQWRASQVADHGLLAVWGAERLPLRAETLDSDKMEIEDADPLHGLTDEEVRDAEDAVNRLGSYDGTHSELLRGVATPVSVAGVARLLGFPADPITGKPMGGAGAIERWVPASEEEVSVGGNGNTIVYDNGNEDERLELDRSSTVLIDIVNRHGRQHGNPTSPMESLQQQCMTLYYLVESILGDSTAKTPAGLLLYPAEVESTLDRDDEERRRARGTNEPLQEDAERSLFAEAIVQPFMDGVTNPSSPFRAVPVMSSVPGDMIEKFRHLRFHNENSDTETVNRIDLLLRWIAISMDMPVEMLLGLGEAATHATARQIERSSYEDHIEPFVRSIADALTAGYLWPELISRGWAPERAREIRIGWLYRGNFGVEDRAKAIFDAWDRVLISDAAARRDLGWHDRDAPDPEEIARRLTQTLAANGFRDSVTDFIEAMIGVTILDPKPERDSKVIANPTAEEVREVEQAQAEDEVAASLTPGIRAVTELAVQATAREGLLRLKHAAQKDPVLKSELFDRPNRGWKLKCDPTQLGVRLGGERMLELLGEERIKVDESFVDQFIDLASNMNLNCMTTPEVFESQVEDLALHRMLHPDDDGNGSLALAQQCVEMIMKENV